MTTDVQESLLTYFYNLLTSDSTLQTNMGGTVRLYPVWATSDAEFPYLVHRINLVGGEIFPEEIGTYYIDIWSDSPNASELVSIRERIVQLIDQLNFNTTDVKNCRLRKVADRIETEQEEGIWHYTFQFHLDIWRQSETVAIIGR